MQCQDNDDRRLATEIALSLSNGDQKKKSRHKKCPLSWSKTNKATRGGRTHGSRQLCSKRLGGKTERNACAATALSGVVDCWQGPAATTTMNDDAVSSGVGRASLGKRDALRRRASRVRARVRALEREKARKEGGNSSGSIFSVSVPPLCSTTKKKGGKKWSNFVRPRPSKKKTLLLVFSDSRGVFSLSFFSYRHGKNGFFFFKNGE